MTFDAILAVDPGEMTGLATWERPTGELGDRPKYQSSEAPFLVALDVCSRWLQERNARGLRMLVLAERFTITKRTGELSRGDTNWSIESIGVLRWITSHIPSAEFHLQAVGTAKAFVPNPVLKQLGIYFTSPGQHANDAMRHLLLGMSKHMREDFERVSWV